MLESLDRLLESASDTKTSQIGMYQNENQRKISAWAAIARVPTVISGIFAMNLQYFPGLKWHWAIFVMLAGTLLACGGLYARFKRSDWL